MKAHLHGGVPVLELKDAEELLDRAGVDVSILFADRGNGYADWCHNVTSANGIEAAHQAISHAVSRRVVSNPWPLWWADTVVPMLPKLPDSGHLFGWRDLLVESFTTRMVSVGIDRFVGAGMAATWWEECFYDFETAASRGWKVVVEAWLTTAEAGQNDKNGPDLADQPVIRLLAETTFSERDNLVSEYTHLDTEIKSTEVIDEDGDESEMRFSSAEIRNLKSARAKAKRRLKAIDDSLVAISHQTLDVMSQVEAISCASTVLRNRAEGIISDYYVDIERSTLAWYSNLINKYSTDLRSLIVERDFATDCLDKNFQDLGYG